MENKTKEQIMRAELEEMTKLYGWKPNGFAAIAFGRGWQAHEKQAAHIQAENERLREALDGKIETGLITEISFLLEYLLEHHDGVGVCLGYQSDKMIESLLKKIKKFDCYLSQEFYNKVMNEEYDKKQSALNKPAE